MNYIEKVHANKTTSAWESANLSLNSSDNNSAPCARASVMITVTVITVIESNSGAGRLRRTRAAAAPAVPSLGSPPVILLYKQLATSAMLFSCIELDVSCA